MKIVTILAVAIFAVASANVQPCGWECPLILAQVCGYDPRTNTFKTFDNECYIGTENCLKNTNYHKRYEGPCVQTQAQSLENCNWQCSELLDPVCGYDPKTNTFKTFSSACHMGAENCREKTNFYRKFDGECIQPKQESVDNCSWECPLISLPVCGYDPRTNSYKEFASACVLGVENCRQRTNYYVRNSGRCISPKEDNAPAEA